jgi:hypothetical protein
MICKETESEIEQVTEEDEGLADDLVTEDDDSDEYTPSAKPTPRPFKVATKRLAKEKGKMGSSVTKAGHRSTRSVSLLGKQIKDISLSEDICGADDSITIVPNRKARAAYGGTDVEFVPGKGDIDTTKRKKR